MEKRKGRQWVHMATDLGSGGLWAVVTSATIYQMCWPKHYCFGDSVNLMGKMMIVFISGSIVVLGFNEIIHRKYLAMG